MVKKGMKAEGIEEIAQITLENLLMEKFRELQLARETGDAGYFDTVSQSIEVLMKACPVAYNDLMVEKSEMVEELQKEYAEIEKYASTAPDEIYKQHILETRVSEADWLFRITYEELLVEVMQKNQIIGVISPGVPEIMSEEEEPQEFVAEEEDEIKIEKPQKMKVKKPKLLKH